MPNDLLAEPRLSLSALARREGVHLSTCWRWCLRGVRGHKLESFNLGAKRFTTEPAFARWIAATNGHAAPTTSPRQREGAIAAAEKELSAAGW